MYMSMNTNSPLITEQYSIANARRNLPSLVRSAQDGTAVELTRHGKPVAVLIGRREFDELTSGRRSFTEAWNAFTESVDLAELALDPDDLLKNVRDDSPGRDVRL